MIDPFLTGILWAYGVFMIGMFTPGPNILAVIGTSMSVGRSQGKALAWGGATGSFCWAMRTAIGLSARVSAFASILIILKFVGAGYLLWLAYKAFKSALTVKDLDVRAVRVNGGLAAFYRRGLLIQMTNAWAPRWTWTGATGLSAWLIPSSTNPLCDGRCNLLTPLIPS